MADPRRNIDVTTDPRFKSLPPDSKAGIRFLISRAKSIKEFFALYSNPIWKIIPIIQIWTNLPYDILDVMEGIYSRIGFFIDKIIRGQLRGLYGNSRENRMGLPPDVNINDVKSVLDFYLLMEQEGEGREARLKNYHVNDTFADAINLVMRIIFKTIQLKVIGELGGLTVIFKRTLRQMFAVCNSFSPSKTVIAFNICMAALNETENDQEVKRLANRYQKRFLTKQIIIDPNWDTMIAEGRQRSTTATIDGENDDAVIDSDDDDDDDNEDDED